jgi:putative ABC transport system permease protein
MLLLARKNLLSEPLRLLISVGGVALAVFLISLLLSLYRGWDAKVGEFVEKSNVDVWVASRGAREFLSASSLLPVGGDRVKPVVNYLDTNPAVDKWSGLIVRQMEAVRVETIAPGQERIGTDMNLQFVGFDTTTRLGGPIKMVDGSDTPGPGEVIIDTALSKRYGVGLGDVIRAGGRDWKAIGRATFGDFVFAQAVFVSHEDAQATLALEGQTTFYVIKLNPGADAGHVVNDLESLTPQIVAFTHDKFTANSRSRALGNVLPILGVVLVLAFVVGLAMAGLTIYTATVEKSREYGILKAVGFNNRDLYTVVFMQSLAIGFLGFCVGISLTLIVGPSASDVVPQFVLFTRWQDVLAVAGATILMALIAAYIPVRRLASIDPVSAFTA